MSVNQSILVSVVMVYTKPYHLEINKLIRKITIKKYIII